MKITITLTAVSLVFLTIACQTAQENITPTSTDSRLSNTTANLKPSSQEIYDTFVQLTLKNSAGTAASSIKKWLPSKAEIKIYWDNGRTTALLSALDKIMTDINNLNKYNKMVRTEAASGADIIINRATIATHNSKYASYQISSSTVQGTTFLQWTSSAITKAIIWLSPTTLSQLQNGVLRHELMHALGIGHTENKKSIMIPVINSGDYDFNNFSILDQRIIQILSDNRVKQGNTEANIRAIIQEYAAK